MNLKAGLKIVPLVAALAIAGCMTNQDQGAETTANAEKVKFISATTASLAQVSAGTGASSTVDYNAIGCPKLGKLVEDLQTNTGNNLPQSFKDFLACFGISGSGSVEDIDAISHKIQNELPAILDCICGGTGLTDILYGTGGAISAFSAASSSAAASSFSASGSSAGEAFNSSSSTAGGSTYTGASSNGYSSP
ncbi:MAG: hypothetical protein K0Q91_1421 [Fibrobacteria bacterium]|jgi:hypothetical protein|nr:hypothetical protein [Fibrobacteria bacterium]